MKTKARRFVTHWAPVIAWMVLIFAGSSDALSAEHTSRFLVPFLRWLDPHISLAAMAQINFVVRKLGHLTEYAVLAALLWRALRATAPSTSTLHIALITLVASALFAILDEFHQSFVATRTASGNDVFIDLCGAIIAIAVCVLLPARRRPTAKL